MLSPTVDSIRLFLHVLAASVWVGGQIVLGALVPTVRRAAPEALPLVARAFARIAWPAFAVAVATGVWNLIDIDVANTTTKYQITLFVKLLLVFSAAGAVVVHQVGRTKAALAIGGALGLVFSLGAFYVGYLLTTGR